MSRPLRIEFPNAIYHVTSRGDRREPIYCDDRYRQVQINTSADAVYRFDAQVLTYGGAFGGFGAATGGVLAK